jgi:hypothetical protein
MRINLASFILLGGIIMADYEELLDRAVDQLPL